jgi:hypothetical protein
MLYWTDVYLERDVSDEAMAVAVAAAFGVPADSVAVATSGTDQAANAFDQRSTTVLVQRDPESRPGDFPVMFSMVLKADAIDSPVARMERIGQSLGVPMITDVGTPAYSDAQWRLVAPDGWSDVVSIDMDAFDDDAFVLSPEAHRLLNAHAATSPASHLRHAS